MGRQCGQLAITALRSNNRDFSGETPLTEGTSHSTIALVVSGGLFDRASCSATDPFPALRINR